MTMLADHEIFLVPQQFSTIQSAINAAVGPATIIVAPGVYRESLQVQGRQYLVIQSARLSRRGVTLVGGDAVIAVLTVTASALHLSGIEVRSNAQMRGIFAEGSTLSLQDCIVAGNRIGHDSADLAGAGMLCRGSSVRIQKSMVIGNLVDCPARPAASGGGLHFHGCKIEIAGSTVQANVVYAAGEARGGGVCCERSTMRMWRSRVTDNALYAPSSEGGGMYFKNPLGCQLGGSVITGNSCHEGSGGGIFVEGDDSKLSVHRNTAVRQNHPTDLQIREKQDPSETASPGSV